MRCVSVAVISAALRLLLLLGGSAPALTAGDAQCSSSSSRAGTCTGSEPADRGWRENTAHATTACNVPVLDAGAGGLSLGELVPRLAAATTPLLIRGLLDLPAWRTQADALGNRSALLEQFGDEKMQLSVGTLLSNGPESTKLDGEKLSFMRGAWSAVSESALRASVERQVRAGKASPRVKLGAWLTALREGTAPPDSYVFQNVSGRGPVAQALKPLHALWRDVDRDLGVDRPDLTRLGVGGSGSGAPFHDHDVIALNVAFAGRKRWLITRPCRPNCRIPFFKSGAAVYHPEMLLDEGRLQTEPPQVGLEPGLDAAMRLLGEGEQTWDCTQHAGEVVFVPALFLHATVNLDESVAVAVQCDDGADPRVGLSELNALIVHANGAATSLGVCGIEWESPFKISGGGDSDVSADRAVEMLETLPEFFRGDPAVFLNRPARDGRAPVDVAAQFGSARVASILAAHGARFLPRHLAVAQQHGHTALAAFIAIGSSAGGDTASLKTDDDPSAASSGAAKSSGWAPIPPPPISTRWPRMCTPTKPRVILKELLASRMQLVMVFA